jgi:DNA polymerase
VENKVHIDFETRSAADLRAVGVHKYAAHPSTDIMCLSVAFNDEPTDVVGFAVGSKSLPLANPTIQRLANHIVNGGIVAAHNASFELAIWEHVAVKKYVLPYLRAEQMDCTMVRAYAAALPGSLDGARASVGITVEKDLAGGRLMLKMCKPKTHVACPACFGLYAEDCSGCNGAGELYTWHEDPADVAKLFAYCRRDTDVERELDKRIPKLLPVEKKLFVLDYEINRRGVTVDVGNARKAAALVEKEGDRLDEEMRRITGKEVATCNAHKQLTAWINSQGVPTKGVAKDAVTELLAKTDLPEIVRSAIGIRKEAAKTSTAKLEKMLTCAGLDSRLRGMFQFTAATTRRWAGRMVQLHNLPRPKIEQEAILKFFNALETMPLDEAREYIEIFHGSPMSIVSDCLRGFLTAAPGELLGAVDFSAIEARVTAWIAGQLDALEVFRTHGKIYEAQAAKTYRVPLEAITKKDIRRQVGKVQVLGLGFGGGVNAIQKMCVTYETKVEPAFDGLWELATPDRRERVQRRYAEELGKAKRAVEKLGALPDVILKISKKEWMASELLKLSYRDVNQDVVRYWTKIEEAAVNAVDCPGSVFVVDEKLPRIRFVVKGSWLICELPSGGRLYYPYPEVRVQKTSWGEYKRTLTYKNEDSTTGKWLRTSTYGGKLTENVVQAIARDLLCEAMLRVSAEGYEIVMHVHDEFVVEDEVIDLEELENIARVVPAWASGLPIDAEGWIGFRYRK